MVENSLPISRVVAHVPRQDLRRMLRLVRLLFRLSQSFNYRQQVFPQLPEVARYDPGHASLMMGYDFHLTPSGPQLIEVNTNAGGGYLAWLSEQQTGKISTINLSQRYETRLLDSYLREWQDFSASNNPLKTIALLDEEPQSQPLFPEMLACCDWLCGQGFDAQVVAPQQLDVRPDGVYCGSKKIDLIYNRHCDFFLETDVMADLRTAYLRGKVCLSPNPFAYGLLADKRRMILWSDPQALDSLDLQVKDRDMLLAMVPHSFLFSDRQPDELWELRKNYIFKPVTRFGSRGVLMGKSISRNRFAALEPATTLVQKVVSPSVECDQTGREFKVDLRLFVYRDHLLGLGARLYQGQVTNLQTEGGGFAPVRIV